MAVIFMSYCQCLVGKNHKIREYRSTKIPRSLIPLSCQSRKSAREEDSSLKKEEKPPLVEALNGMLMKMGKRLEENLSPKQKGDWKDLLLMSVSFAVYVYMSQKIVCAYCAWMSTQRQPW